MTLRTPARASALALVLSASMACGHAPASAARATTMAAPVAVAPTLDGALASITRASIERDLAAVARPRHHRAAPEGLRAVRAYVAEQLAAAGLTVTSQTVAHDGAEADNVIGERAGDPSRVVLVGAHYDAVEGTDGADDNATGVAVMLAAARATRSLTPGATVRFAAFAFEEQGCIGSQAYVRAMPEDERRRVRAALVVDMAGYTNTQPGSQRMPEGLPEFLRRRIPDRADFIGAAASDPLMETLRRAQEMVPGLKAQVVPLSLASLVPDLLRSDHAPFFVAGMPAMIASDTAEMRSPHYHRPTDTTETLDLEFTTRVARWITAATVLSTR